MQLGLFNSTSPLLAMLTPSQNQELRKLLVSTRRVNTLIGPAGTGKTTLLRAFIEVTNAPDYVLLAPTGKAALVLSEKTKMPATTIHSALFGRSKMVNGELHFLDVRSIGSPGGWVIIDESSMIDEYLFRTIIKYLHKEARILFVGDRVQLPPAKGKIGPDLINATAELTEIMRQGKDSSIITIATAVREGKKISPLFNNKDSFITADAPATWWTRTNGDKVILTHSNASRNKINADVRKQLGYNDWLVPGEIIVCKRNNTRTNTVNGEFLIVESITPLNLSVPVLVDGIPRDIEDWYSVRCSNRPDMIYVLNKTYPMLDIEFVADKKKQTVSILDTVTSRLANKKTLSKRDVLLATITAWQYAYCVTVHTSQGSEFDHVYFYQKGSDLLALISPAHDEHKKMQSLYYTAITRARKTITLNSCIPGQP